MKGGGRAEREWNEGGVERGEKERGVDEVK